MFASWNPKNATTEAEMTDADRFRSLTTLARFVTSIICGVLVVAFGYSAYKHRRLDLLRENGLMAIAEVVSISDEWHLTSSGKIDAKRMKFTFSTNEGRVIHGVENIILGVKNLPAPGEQFPVWYDHDQPTRVLTPWPAYGGTAMIRCVEVALGITVLWIWVMFLSRTKRSDFEEKGKQVRRKI